MVTENSILVFTGEICINHKQKITRDYIGISFVRSGNVIKGNSIVSIDKKSLERNNISLIKIGRYLCLSNVLWSSGSKFW